MIIVSKAKWKSTKETQHVMLVTAISSMYMELILPIPESRVHWEYNK